MIFQHSLKNGRLHEALCDLGTLSPLGLSSHCPCPIHWSSFPPTHQACTPIAASNSCPFLNHSGLKPDIPTARFSLPRENHPYSYNHLPKVSRYLVKETCLACWTTMENEFIEFVWRLLEGHWNEISSKLGKKSQKNEKEG